MLPPYRAVVLDLDGLLLDTEPTYRRAWRKAACAMGFALEDVWLKQLSGLSIDAVEAVLCQTLGAKFDPKRFHSLSTRYWEEWISRHGIPLKPGYHALLKALCQLQLPYALATNSHRPYAEKVLHLAGIREDFPLLITRSEVQAGKPAPDIFLEAARCLAQPPADCLAVEDSEAGLLAAHRAGMKPVWIPDAAPTSPTTARLAVACFSSLKQLAQALLSSPSKVQGVVAARTY